MQCGRPTSICQRPATVRGFLHAGRRPDRSRQLRILATTMEELAATCRFDLFVWFLTATKYLTAWDVDCDQLERLVRRRERESTYPWLSRREERTTLVACAYGGRLFAKHSLLAIDYWLLIIDYVWWTMGDALLIINYWILTIDRWLLTIDHRLLAINYWVLTIADSRLTINYWLLTIHYRLQVVNYCPLTID